MKNSKLIKTLATTYVEHCRTHEGKFDWSGSEVSARIESGEVSRLELLNAAAALCTTDNELSQFLITPLLQDLLYSCTESLGDDIKRIAQQSLPLRRLLQMIYLPPNTPTRRLLEGILQNSGLVYGMLPSQEYPYGVKIRSNASRIWAWNWFHNHPPELKIVCMFLDNCTDLEEFNNLARGCFSKLVVEGGASILSELDDLAWKSKKVRKALCGVIVEPDTPAAEVLEHLLVKYKLTYNSL